MQSIYWTGRLLSRALWNGIASYSTACGGEQQPSAAVASTRRRETSLVSAVCGFPKDFARSRIRRGQFGDDAWFTARFRTAEVIGGRLPATPAGSTPRDRLARAGALLFPSRPISRFLSLSCSGIPVQKPEMKQSVADGVGGWRHYGIDPGEFSNFLMRTCERLVSMGRFTPTEPAGLLARSYYELLENKQPILGSSTACVIVLNKETSCIYAANIGDSGFVVVRRGEVVHRSSEQQHYFNTPFQLSLPPPGHSDLVLRDSPESADTSSFGVEDGDVILLATDGVFDNVPDQLLVTEMRKIEGERDPTKIQCVANTIAWMARRLAFDGAFMSPFAQNARENGIDAIGGKPDDITVLLATVAI
ncbi:Uncharacterized protein DBV15_00090 [Temnothorax longispinosus]|uniref:Protein phosphatase n=1 Tax=Temnothorax longispinosus TaxID=300112 RepID=A0A4V3SA29_9HYME|nr:Uncharacterized protein DBV15_00090 [Temnothorax longispinosus]